MQSQTSPITEISLNSAKEYPDPIRDVSVSATFRGPNGETVQAPGFWDGGDRWKVRAALPIPGEWTYESRCTDETDGGLHSQQGTVQNRATPDDQPGPLRVAADGTHLTSADGTPFFWLADTAWNGVLKAQPEDWDEYLQARKAQGFTAVQFVLTQWRAFPQDNAGQKAFSGTENIRIHPEFYQKLDAKFAAVGRAGLLPAPVLVWSCTPQDPGYYLPAEDCTLLAAYEVARYACYRPVWLLGGDGEYRGEHAQKWREVGRAVFGDSGQEIVTMHPRGVNWPNEDLRQEPWLSFLSYQSGHGDSDEHLRWLTQGPPASNWDNPPRKPVINQEPNYEHHLSYHQRQEFNDFHVRRAAYWSLLVTPPAGVTYGHHGVWPWMEEPGVPLDHNRSGVAPTWREALSAPGAASMTHLHDLFRQMDWWTLRPAQNLLYEQPGETDPSRFVAIAASQDGNLTVAYTPAGQPVALRDFDPLDTTTSWYDPSLGAWHEAPLVGGLFPPPDGRDWLLVIRREG